MIKSILVMAAVFVASGFSASAQSYSGANLKNACLSEAPTEADAMMCFSTILAAKESFGWGAMVVVYRLGGSETPLSEVIDQANNLIGICIDESISNRDVISKVIDYLISTENLESITATRAVFSGLVAAFPCES